MKHLLAAGLLRRACTVFAALAISLTAPAQSLIDSMVQQDKETAHKYRMNYWFATGFSVAATAANIYAIPSIIKAKTNLTDAEVNALNPNAPNKFDRWALKLDPTKRDINYERSDILLPAAVIATAALGFDRQIRKDWLRIFVMYYEMHAITFSLYNFSPFGPAFQNKVRPFSYYQEFPIEDRRTGNQRNSLYSGHTASAAAATFFMAKVYCDYHPELGRKKYLLYAAASVPPLFEGYLRMKALAHFPSDILVGFVIGATAGIAVPELHKYHDRRMHLSLVPTPAGPGFSLNWNPVSDKKAVVKNWVGM
jgi:hypothetical protein